MCKPVSVTDYSAILFEIDCGAVAYISRKIIEFHVIARHYIINIEPGDKS